MSRVLEVVRAVDIDPCECLRELELEKNEYNILNRWGITVNELTKIVAENPSLRGTLLGYIAETKLRTMWFSCPEVTYASKPDDHDRKKKGDLYITYRGNDFKIECKSLQTSSIIPPNSPKNPHNIWKGKAQCDASDRRPVVFPDGTSVETTCLLINEFDLLAINLFSFENHWRFIFIKNQDLPRSTSKKYTPYQRQYLLAGSVKVSWPPQPPFSDEPFRLLDEIAQERLTEDLPEILAVEEVEHVEQTTVFKIEE